LKWKRKIFLLVPTNQHLTGNRSGSIEDSVEFLHLSVEN
jgi:hypothetical protein